MKSGYEPENTVAFLFEGGAQNLEEESHFWGFFFETQEEAWGKTSMELGGLIDAFSHLFYYNNMLDFLFRLLIMFIFYGKSRVMVVCEIVV